MPEATRDEIRDKRRAILHAARELFATQGYDDTTIAEVARASGRCRGDRLPVLREQARHSGGCLPGAKRDDCCGHPIAHDSGLTIAASATRDYRGDLSEFPREHALYDLLSG